jgi:hypothetical protein
VSSDNTRLRVPRDGRGDEVEPAAPREDTGRSSEFQPPQGAAGARAYSEKEVGQLIALATKLQMQAAPPRAQSGPTSVLQVREIARSLGIEDAHLDHALSLLGQGEGSLVFHGVLPDVRQRLAEHFAAAVWHSGNVHQPALTPRIVFDGQTGLTISWAGASLRMRLAEPAEGSTEVSWEIDFPIPEVGGFWSNVVFGVLGVAPALVIAATGALAPAVMWGLGVGGSCLGGRALQKLTLQRLRNRFNSFCRNHLENLHVLLLPRGPG